jgi:hypothetical protein
VATFRRASRCLSCIRTFFGLNENHKEMLHKEANFLVFFGKYDYHSVKRMPTFYRKRCVDWTVENLKAIYGE